MDTTGNELNKTYNTIFVTVRYCYRNRRKDDLHSFAARTENGIVFVEARENSIYMREIKNNGEQAEFIGTVSAVTDKLLEIKTKPETIEI